MDQHNNYNVKKKTSFTLKPLLEAVIHISKLATYSTNNFRSKTNKITFKITDQTNLTINLLYQIPLKYQSLNRTIIEAHQ